MPFCGIALPPAIGDHIALLLAEDVVVGVVDQVERVVADLVGGGLVLAMCLGQAVEVVVAELLLVRAAEGGGRRDVDLVGKAQDVADLVIAVVQVLEGAGARACALQGIQATAGGVVAVVGLDAVAEHKPACAARTCRSGRG